MELKGINSNMSKSFSSKASNGKNPPLNIFLIMVQAFTKNDLYIQTERGIAIK